MAKQPTTAAFNVGTLFGTVHANVMAGTARDEVAAIAVESLKRASLAQVIAAYVGAETSAATAKAIRVASVSRAYELLAAKKIDLTDVDAMRDTLWPDYWAAAGGKGAPVKGDTPESERFYMRHYMAAKRMAESIAKVSAGQTTTRVPREAQEAADRLLAAQKKFIAAYGEDVLREAMKRARKAK